MWMWLSQIFRRTRTRAPWVATLSAEERRTLARNLRSLLDSKRFIESLARSAPRR